MQTGKVVCVSLHITFVTKIILASKKHLDFSNLH